MKHAPTRMVFAYWDALRGERLTPDRAEIEPSAIRQALADCFILDVDPFQGYPLRLAGTRLCALFGRDLKETAFTDWWQGDAARDGAALVDTVVGETAPIVAGVIGVTRSGRGIAMELLLLPLRLAGRPNARILGVLSTAELPDWLGFDPVTSVTMRSLRVIRTDRRPNVVPLLAPGELGRPERRGHLTVYPGGK
jgi:hypothetical protein